MPAPTRRFLRLAIAGLMLAMLQLRADAANSGMQVQLPPSEYQALVDLYNSTDGPHWTTRTAWLQPSAGSWFGVTVNGVQYDSLGNVTAPGYVEKVALFRNQLRGTIPSSLGNLTRLQFLQLGVNFLHGVIPSSLGNLTQLQYLSLAANDLSGAIPSSLGNLTNLHDLDLYNNLLSGEIPSSLGNLTNLQNLRLAGNPLTGVIPSSLGNLSNLQYLALQYSQLSGPIPSSLGNLSNLLDLDLSDSELSGAIPPSLSQLTHLRTLELDENKLSGTIPPALGNLIYLQSLLLDGNQITGAIPSSFENLTNLTFVRLNHNRFTGNFPAISMPGGYIYINYNFIDVGSGVSQANIQALRSRGVTVFDEPQISSPTPTPNPGARLLNISTRTEVLDGDKVLIAGFIVSGSDRYKKLLVRGIAPSLPVKGALADPVLELHSAYGLIATNDNWKINDATGESQQAEIEATTAAPAKDPESALITTVTAPHTPSIQYGTLKYTVIMRGKGGGTGIGVVEVYDLDQSAHSELLNISTRGFVGAGDEVMIGGFIAAHGDGPTRFAIRAIGPSLASSGVSSPLDDPTLELHDGNGAVLATNDNWKEGGEAAVRDTGLAPQYETESVIIATLPVGAYTAIVRGQDNATGVALVEMYNLTNAR
jgi:Leucine-rich repeat (LRR) protein